MTEKDSSKYLLTLVITLIGVSATQFVNFSDSTTFVFLLFLPLLYGYTAFISKDGFQYSSLTSLMAGFFTVLGGFTALMAVLYGFGNIMVSKFAGGQRFRDYYGSVSMALILSGLIIGAGIFTFAAFDQDFKQENVEKASNKIAETSQNALANTKIAEQQRENQLRFVNQTSESAVTLTTEKVFKESNPSQEVKTVLEDAEEDIPRQMYKRTLNKIQEEDPRTKQRLARTLEEGIESNFILVIPLTAFIFITLQPLIGALTATFAEIFSKIFS